MKYKIVISEIIEKEVPELEYQRLTDEDEDETEKKVYGYVDTGRTKIETRENNVYQQEIEHLDVGDLARYINEK